MDAPRCLNCIDEGKIGQTYWNLTSRTFKCKSCGHQNLRTSYQEIDYLWREKPLEWSAKVRPSLTKVGQKKLDTILESEVKPR